MIETPRFIWEPSREFIESTNVYRFMRRLGIATYQDFIRYSQEHLEEFWDEMVREVAIEWFEPFEQALDASRGVEWARWFTGGKLNIAWNCLGQRGRVRPSGGNLGRRRRQHPHPYLQRTAARNGPAGERPARPRSRAGRPRGALYADGSGSVHDSLRVLQTGACRGADILRLRLRCNSRAAEGFGRPSAVHLRFPGAARAAIPLKQKADEALARGCAIERVVLWRYKGGDVPWNRRLVARFRRRPTQAMRGAAARFGSARAVALHVRNHRPSQGSRCIRNSGALAQTAKGDLPDVRSPARRPLLVGLRHRLDDGAVGDYRELGGAIMLYEGPPDDPTAERFWQMIEHRVTTLGFHRRPSGC